MPLTTPVRWSAALLLLAALAGAIIALYAWFTPLTGVTGSLGAIATAIACALLAVVGWLLHKSATRAARSTWGIITLLLLLAISFAAALLHQPAIIVAMVVGLIGLIARLRAPAYPAQTARF